MSRNTVKYLDQYKFVIKECIYKSRMDMAWAAGKNIKTEVYFEWNLRLRLILNLRNVITKHKICNVGR